MEKQNLTQKEALEMLKQMDIQAITQNLIYYSEQKDLNKVQLLLIGGVNPNERFVNSKNRKMVALVTAAGEGDLSIIKVLLEYGSDINVQDEDGRTALHLAILYDQKEAVKFLIEKGADVNTLTNVKTNALYMAQEKKNSEIIELLKNAGAREMNEEEKKEFKKEKTVKVASKIIVLGCCFGLAYWCTNHKSTSGSGSSSASHTCTWCGKSYTGNGYMHIGDNCSMATNGWERTDHQCTIKCCEESWNSGRR